MVPSRLPEAGESGHLLGRLGDGKKDRENCARGVTVWVAVSAAANPNRSPVPLHDAARDPESEPGAGVFLGGVEGLKNAAQAVGSDTAAVVVHGDAHAGTKVSRVVRRDDADLQAAAGCHGVDGID